MLNKWIWFPLASCNEPHHACIRTYFVGWGFKSTNVCERHGGEAAQGQSVALHDLAQRRQRHDNAGRQNNVSALAEICFLTHPQIADSPCVPTSSFSKPRMSVMTVTATKPEPRRPGEQALQQAEDPRWRTLAIASRKSWSFPWIRGLRIISTNRYAPLTANLSMRTNSVHDTTPQK